MNGNGNARLPQEQMGPAERMLQLFLNFRGHLWSKNKIQEAEVVRVYRQMGEIYSLDNELAARLASHVMLHTDWKDMRVVCAAFMLAQGRHGEAVRENGEILFHDDDYRAVGEAMLKFYERGSDKMMKPSEIARVAQVLDLPGVAAVNKELGFCHEHKRKPHRGRFNKAVAEWLANREANPVVLQSLADSGWSRTVRRLCNNVGYKPSSERFFQILRWKQKQSADGHRTMALDRQVDAADTFEGLTEEQICERIAGEKIPWRKAISMLPETGLTPAIMAALSPSLSDKDWVIFTPTLEELGLLRDRAIKARWQEAASRASDQRARKIAENVRSRELAEKLHDGADASARKVVAEATRERDVFLFVVVDISSSMEKAIHQSKDFLKRVLPGFDPDKIAIVAFNTMAKILPLRHASAAGVDHLFKGIQAGGGTMYSVAIQGLRASGIEVPPDSDLIMLFIGDEAGHDNGQQFARVIQQSGYRPAAFGHIVVVAPGWNRGSTVRGAAQALNIPYTEVVVEQFEDSYQVNRSLRALLEAPVAGGRFPFVDKVMATPLLQKPY